MSVRTITLPWNDGSGDHLYVEYNDSYIPGTFAAKITSDDNYTGQQRQKMLIWQCYASGPNNTDYLTVTQLTDNLVIATFGNNGTVRSFGSAIAGYPKN